MTAELKTRQRKGKEKHEVMQPDRTLERVATAHEWLLKVFKLLFNKVQSSVLLQPPHTHTHKDAKASDLTALNAERIGAQKTIK